MHTDVFQLALGTSAAGVMVREEPMARQSSALHAVAKLASRVSVGENPAHY